uniref:Dihydrofolate reductase n=1 Tax=Rhabditophanes sp. KR3021 TaxID=114890 RepID=A0AC35UED9_9BILA
MAKYIPKFQLIWAEDSQNGIGKNGTLPWNLPKEMAHFKKTTMEVSSPDKMNMVIMGKKSYDSIPAKFRPLAKRFNVVLSRTLAELDEGNLMITNSLDKVIKKLAEDIQFRESIEHVFVIGGRQIYNEVLLTPFVDKLIVTKIRSSFDCDVIFPDFARENFAKISQNEEVVNEKGIEYSIEYYQKQ